ncbi:DUF881 domain-containing protein [Streptomyces sp. NPDC092296]|uniref:DUF881 domain-containing protein n=1 Tax=Streptomyces sp. NPDC092296 TaxID=3366012 RepID=UPI00382C12D4
MPEKRTTREPDARYARPDASMSLLTNVMDHSLDDGYAEAARRRGAYGSSRMPSAARGRLVLAVGLALAAIVVTVGGVQSHEAAPTLAKERQELIDRIDAADSSADRMQQDIERLRTQVDDAQRQALNSSGEDQRLQGLGLVAGTVAATGPGLKLVVDDAPDAVGGEGGTNPRDSSGFGNSGRVRDRDLQLVVNGLWVSGAEAVAVNGQRLTALSAIRAAGDAILVDNRPLVPPYTVLAIGDGRGLGTRFHDSVGGRYLKLLQDDYGIRASVSVQGSVDVPAATGVTLRYARPQKSAAAKPGPGKSKPGKAGPGKAGPARTGASSAGAGTAGAGTGGATP